MLLALTLKAAFGLVAFLPTYLLLRRNGGILRATVAFFAGFATGIAAVFAAGAALGAPVFDGLQIGYHGAQGSVLGPLLAIWIAYQRRRAHRAAVPFPVAR